MPVMACEYVVGEASMCGGVAEFMLERMCMKEHGAFTPICGEHEPIVQRNVNSVIMPTCLLCFQMGLITEVHVRVRRL